MTFRESARLWDQGFADLEKQDKTLSAGVHECIWDQMLAEQDITIEEWRKKGLKNAARIDRIRAELRQSGSL